MELSVSPILIDDLLAFGGGNWERGLRYGFLYRAIAVGEAF